MYDELRRLHPMGRRALRDGITVEHRAEGIDQVDDTPPDAGLMTKDRNACLRSAVNGLPPRLRSVITARYFEGRTNIDLAREMGVSDGRIAQMHRRAESILRCQLARDFEVMRTVVYKAEDGFRWRARADNGEIVSESGEAYEDKSYAITAAKKFGPADSVVVAED